jgi:hypothetical protein
MFLKLLDFCSTFFALISAAELPSNPRIVKAKRDSRIEEKICRM